MNMICVAYFTGAVGQSIGMFYFGNGVISGVDVGGLKYDGNLSRQIDGSFEGTVTLKIPAGTQLITGLAAGSSDHEMASHIRLPKDFATTGEVIRIDTPAGAVSARFELLREVP